MECADRKYDPLSTHLVVADAGRTEKTICLAVSPSLKAHGVPGRPRLFEVYQQVREINRERFRRARDLGVLPRGEDGKYRFASSSFDADALAADPALELAFIVAPPRMALYEKVSARVFSIYMKYVSPDDIHVYSIDECFLDVTAYLRTYRMSAHELAVTMIREVLYATGITATAGIGTNLYLAKVAMDIVAKRVPADRDGVRIAELDERSYRKLLWCHTPLTDFWRVGRGTARRVARLGCLTMGDIARQSVVNESALYSLLGVNAELLIDHAWGWEPTVISEIKRYRPESKSLSSGQVLKEPYDAEKGKLIVREMTELLALDLVRKGLVTKKITLTLCYHRASVVCTFRGTGLHTSAYRVARTGEPFSGKLGLDPYGRPVPVHSHGTGNLDRYTSSSRKITRCMMELYDRIMNPDYYLHRVYVVAADLIPENGIPDEAPEQLDFFTDYAERDRRLEEDKRAEDRERKLQRTALRLQDRYGKNALLKGMNLMEGGTTVERNGQIGGHRAGEDAPPVLTRFSAAGGNAGGRNPEDEQRGP